MNLVWKVKLPGATRVSPIIGHDTVTYFCADGSVVRLDKANGSAIQRDTVLGGGVLRWIRIDDYSAILQVPKGDKLYRYTINAPGDYEPEPIMLVPGFLIASAILEGGVLYATLLQFSKDRHVVESMVLSADLEGRVLWSRNLDPGYWIPDFVGGSKLVLTRTNWLKPGADYPGIEVTLTTGELRQLAPKVATDHRIVRSNQDSLFVVTKDGQVSCIERSSLACRWTVALGLPVFQKSLTLDGGRLWVSRDGELLGMDLASGSVMVRCNYAVRDEDNSISAALLFTDRVVCFGSYNRRLWAFDKNSGKHLDSLEVIGYIAHTPAPDGGDVFVGTTHDYAYRVESPFFSGTSSNGP